MYWRCYNVWCVFMPKCGFGSEIVIRCRTLCSAENLWFAAEVELAAANCDSLPKLSCLQRINIHCRNLCSAANLWFAAEVELAAAKLWFAAEIWVLPWICDSLPKLSCLQRINIRCGNLCSAANLWFAAKVELAAAKLRFVAEICVLLQVSQFTAEVELAAAKLWFIVKIELSAVN